MRLRQSSNFCYSMYLKLKLQATKVTSIYTLDKSIKELTILQMLQHHYEPTLPLTPRTTSHHRVLIRAHYIQTVGLVIVVVIHHRRHCPPSPSLSTTAAIVAIMGFIVAWCSLIPSSSSPLSSTAATTSPTTVSPPPRLVLLPPAIPPPLAVVSSPPSQSQSPMALSWTGMRHGHPPGPTRRVPLPSPCWGAGPLCQRHRHDHRNASVSSPAVSGRPSFASRAVS